MTTAEPQLPALRQLVFLAADLPTTLAAARSELGLGSGVRDESGMAALGFTHEVLTIDQTFLEFSAPLGPDTRPGRLVAKRGDLGYMVVVQVADLEETKARAAGLGMTPVFETPYESHTISQWHPRDLGTLAELDQIRPSHTWHLAPEVFAQRNTDVVGDFVAVEIAVAQPQMMAERWAAVLGVPLGDDGRQVILSGRTIRFVPTVDARSGVGLVGVELPATDRSQSGRTIRLSGVDFRLT